MIATPSKAAPAARVPRIAYLVNQYPKVSHSFIRREILALERRGLAIQRYAVRGWEEETPEPADRDEQARTRYLLRSGLAGLVLPSLRTLFAAPGRFVEALRLALRLSRHADRPLPYQLIYLAQACLLHEWMAAAGATHLHAHFGTNPAAVALLARALGGPLYSFTVHGPEEFDKAEALHLSEKIRHAAFVVAISSYGRSQLYRWSRSQDWHRIHVVHCGLEPSFHAGLGSDPPDVPRLVCVGRLCAQKGQLLLVEAAARIVRSGLPLELVLAGDGEMRSEIEALVADRDLGAHVRITGWIGGDRVREEILAARVLALPSFAEGLPVVIMEAMALRRPVVSTFVAGIPELVRDGEDGWLIPAGDLEALVTVLHGCLAADASELARRGRAAHDRVLERHDVDVEAGRLARLFAADEGRAEP